MRILRGLLTLVGLLCIVYLGVTAYLGYRVGSAIHAAEQQRIIREGAHIVGRGNMERYAVRRSGIPEFLVESPTFWLALHRSE